MSLQKNANLPQDTKLLLNPTMFEQLETILSIWFNYKKLTTQTFPGVASALAYGLAFMEECDSCLVPWEVGGNCVTSRPRKKRDKHIFFPAPWSFLKAPFPKGWVGLPLSLHFYSRLPQDDMYKKRWVASGQSSTNAVWKSTALLPPLPSNGTGNSLASGFPTSNYLSTFLTHSLPSTLSPLDCLPSSPLTHLLVLCVASLQHLALSPSGLPALVPSTSVVEKCQWTMLIFLNYVFASSFGLVSFPACCCKACWASLACSLFFLKTRNI